MVKHPFYYHLRFLLTYISIERIEMTFLQVKLKRDVALSVLSGEKLYDVDLQYEGIMFDFQSGKQKFPCFGVILNWIMQSIFWEFSY